MSDTGILVSLEDEVVYRSNVVLDYTCRDFTAIRAQLVGLAKGLMPEWQTAGEASDFGTLLLELFSYMGDVMHYLHRPHCQRGVPRHGDTSTERAVHRRHARIQAYRTAGCVGRAAVQRIDLAIPRTRPRCDTADRDEGLQHDGQRRRPRRVRTEPGGDPGARSDDPRPRRSHPRRCRSSPPRASRSRTLCSASPRAPRTASSASPTRVSCSTQ